MKTLHVVPDISTPLCSVKLTAVCASPCFSEDISGQENTSRDFSVCCSHVVVLSKFYFNRPVAVQGGGNPEGDCWRINEELNPHWKFAGYIWWRDVDRDKATKNVA
jgi:hypothetical protein